VQTTNFMFTWLRESSVAGGVFTPPHLLDIAAVVDARLAADGFEAKECGGGGACGPNCVEVLTGEGNVRSQLARFVLDPKQAAVVSDKLRCTKVVGDALSCFSTIQEYASALKNSSFHFSRVIWGGES